MANVSEQRALLHTYIEEEDIDAMRELLNDNVSADVVNVTDAPESRPDGNALRYATHHNKPKSVSLIVCAIATGVVKIHATHNDLQNALVCIGPDDNETYISERLILHALIVVHDHAESDAPGREGEEEDVVPPPRAQVVDSDEATAAIASGDDA